MNEIVENINKEYLININQIEKRVPNVKVNGHRTKRLPGNSNISFLISGTICRDPYLPPFTIGICPLCTTFR